MARPLRIEYPGAYYHVMSRQAVTELKISLIKIKIFNKKLFFNFYII